MINILCYVPFHQWHYLSITYNNGTRGKSVKRTTFYQKKSHQHHFKIFSFTTGEFPGFRFTSNWKPFWVHFEPTSSFQHSNQDSPWVYILLFYSPFLYLRLSFLFSVIGSFSFSLPSALCHLNFTAFLTACNWSFKNSEARKRENCRFSVQL